MDSRPAAFVPGERIARRDPEFGRATHRTLTDERGVVVATRALDVLDGGERCGVFLHRFTGLETNADGNASHSGTKRSVATTPDPNMRRELLVIVEKRQ